MYSFEYEFFPADRDDGLDRFIETTLGSFLSELFRNGYLIDREWNLVFREDRLRLTCLCPTADALEKADQDLRESADRGRLLRASQRPPVFRLLGPAVSSPECCSCDRPSWYLLFTTFITTGPPVRCGDCAQAVPLYRLPGLAGEQEHSSIRGWEGIYQACDTLFMSSGVGEEWGYQQVSDVTSDLSREGRRICAAMEARMGHPWFYYLNRYEEPQTEACPICGLEWAPERCFREHFHYRCHPCRLLAADPL